MFEHGQFVQSGFIKYKIFHHFIDYIILFFSITNANKHNQVEI